MSNDLESGLTELRVAWEGDAEILLHKESTSGGCHITIQQFEAQGRPYFQVMRYFTIAGDWKVSCDYDGVIERCAWLAAFNSFA